MECPIVKISVRNLVEFILRSGDIDNRIGKMADKDAMQLGSKIHRKIQRQMGADYHAEVYLKHQISYENCILQIEGRADGIIIDENQVVIDEIKGILGELERLEEPKEVHLAQAKCYACIYGLQEGLEEIGVQMTYCQMETEEIRRFQYTYSVQNLAAWFSDIADQYQKWAKFQIDWREKRNASIRTIEFPFVYREGQRELVRDVYRTILRKKQLFIQAPTGVGKTMATVFPAVKAIGEGLGEKLFYLTAKTITRIVAENAFQTLKQQGLNMKVITLTAKEKICFCEAMECNPEACPYAKGHFDRVNDAVFELLNETGEMTREALERQARKHQVCPFEMSLDVASWVDAVICDYNYVFDPTAHLKRFFSEGGSGEYLFLIDEAHNLVERAREMYSAVLYKEDVLEAKRLARYEAPKLAKKLDYKFWVELGLVKATRATTEKVQELQRYFKVSSLSVLSQRDFLVQYRTSVSEVTDVNVINANAWVQTAINLGTQRNVEPFNKKKLLEAIPEIRDMTVQNPKDFYPRLKELLANCGVVLVLLPNLKNCGVNGAVKWLGKEKVVLALNDRRKYADTFWFALFHELGHVLQQRIKVLLVSEIKKAGLETDELIQRLEAEADTFSQNTLIPKAEYDDFVMMCNRNFTAEAIRGFAAKINVLPGIVVGRLQHDGYLTNQTTLNSLKIKYVIG